MKLSLFPSQFFTVPILEASFVFIFLFKRKKFQNSKTFGIDLIMIGHTEQYLSGALPPESAMTVSNEGNAFKLINLGDWFRLSSNRFWPQCSDN